jgi:hypothetical protein
MSLQIRMMKKSMTKMNTEHINNIYEICIEYFVVLGSICAVVQWKHS